MKINEIPRLSPDVPTKCCPRFLPKEWDGKTFQLKDKVFARIVTRSFFYIPLNLGFVITKAWSEIVKWDAADKKQFVMLSHDLSPWKAEHYLWIAKDVPTMSTIKMSGNFLAKVYEGPFSNAPQWIESMKKYVVSKKRTLDTIYLYYTTCPRCAKFYGKNYVVALAKVV